MKNTILSLMKQTMLSLACLLCISTFALSGFMSCASVPVVSFAKEVARKDSKPPIDAFAFVMTETSVEADKCMKSKKYNECLKVINDLPVIRKLGMGSGLLIKAKSETIILTAAHVCNAEVEDYEVDDIKISLKSTTTSTIRNSKGEILSTVIIKIDKENDLCALRPSTVYTKPVHWSRSPPKSGDTVFSISAPLGINSPKMNLIFQGFYSGARGKWHHYSIPAVPGSSGSIVLDKNYKGVGMINAAYLNFHAISMGAGYDAIEKFLNSI